VPGKQTENSLAAMAALCVMVVVDQEFFTQLRSEKYLFEIFRKQYEHRISDSLKEKPHVKAIIATITRALRNRARFAIEQKKRLKEHVNKLHPPDFKQQIIHEVNTDLKSVVELMVHFEKDDKELKRLSFEACRCFRDDIGASFPDVISNDDK
jgi:organic radical activating enzyme